MTDSTATAILRQEHRLILRVLDAFERLLDTGDVGAPTLAALADCLLFFRLFTDACHHGKEEDLLFTALAEEPGVQGPIAMLREEHVEGRAQVRQMGELLERVRGGEADAAAALRQRGAGFAEFLRGHIRREDDGVFEIADDLVQGVACARLCAAYDTVCSRRFEGRSLAELEALGARLVAG